MKYNYPKEVLKKTGIYEIRCKINNHKYIGSAAKNFYCRWGSHICLLKNGIHDNRHLQSAWNKYGKDAFEFVIILCCHKQDCLYYEQLCLDKWWDNSLKCYNISKNAKFSFLGRKHSEESKRKCGEKNKGRKKSKETLEKMSKAFSGKNNPMYGKPSPNLGRTPSKETREKISKAKIGVKHHPDAIKKMSKAKLGKYNGERNPNHKLSKNDIENIIYIFNNCDITKSRLAKNYNVSRRTISRIINRESWVVIN